jgi:hypothetical protein
MPLKLVGDKCRLEVYGPDEEGVRVICNSVTGCPLGHPGEITLDCFGAGSAGRTDAVAGPVATTTQEVRPEGGGPPVETSGHAPGTPEVEPDSHINALPVPHLNKIISHEIDRGKLQDNASEPEKTFSENLGPPDSHMVVAADKPYVAYESEGKVVPVEEKWWIEDMKQEQRKAMVQHYVDKLNEISMEMYLESKSSGPPPIPILGPKETEEFLENLENFKLTPEQQEFYRDARRKFPPEQTRRKLLKHRRRYAPRRTAGMIRMNNEDGEEESQFAVDVPSVKPQTELEKPVPKVERPEEAEEPGEDEDEEVDEAPEQVIEGFETSGDTSLGGYFLGLEVWTDADGDHTVTLTIDAMSYDIMLPDFMEMLGALNKVKGRLQQILNT